MGFYIRKAFRAGPFRLNLSKGGLGISTGIPGLRIGSGPRGNYVHMGKGGLYYRRFARPGVGAANESFIAPPPIPTILPPKKTSETYSSDDVMQLRDSSNQALLDELNAKAKILLYFPVLVICCVVAVILAVTVSALIFLPLSLGLLVSLPLAWRRDMERTVTTLLYKVDDTANDAYQCLCLMFENWKQYLSAGSIPVQSIPPRMATNIRPFSMKSGDVQIYFLPDQILVRKSSVYGAVRYDDVKVELIPHEHQGTVLPLGAKLTDETWEHARKDGGPDMRYKSNAKIYTYLTIGIRMMLPGGVVIDTFVSGFNAADGLAACFKALGLLLQSRMCNERDSLRSMAREMLADERLELSEVKALVQWVKDNRDAVENEPSLRKFVNTLDDIVADGKLTSAERGRLEAALSGV